jgi:GTPase involved in cell partitioning and DNA repair
MKLKLFFRKIKLFGENGADVKIHVPCGVTAIREDTGEILGEVNAGEEQVLLIKGAKGASVANRYVEEFGQSFMVNLDLKLIADVGLIGQVFNISIMGFFF